MTQTPYRAVIFDLGGVVLGSPLHAIAAFEERYNIPANTINRHVAQSHPDGAWHQLERGGLLMGEEFFALFDRELKILGYPVSSREMMGLIKEISKPRPEMLAAIGALRTADFKVAALTNNWKESDEKDSGATDTDRFIALKQHFDLFIESAVLGLRKPDPRIYQHTCQELGVDYSEAVFLDDIGTNLKAARALGMHTIKVDAPHAALQELGATLGLDPNWY